MSREYHRNGTEHQSLKHQSLCILCTSLKGLFLGSFFWVVAEAVGHFLTGHFSLGPIGIVSKYLGPYHTLRSDNPAVLTELIESSTRSAGNRESFNRLRLFNDCCRRKANLLCCSLQLSSSNRHKRRTRLLPGNPDAAFSVKGMASPTGFAGARFGFESPSNLRLSHHQTFARRFLRFHRLKGF